MPSFFSVSTTVESEERRISGNVCSCSSFAKARSVYSRKHLPGRVRPARPARCAADALEMGDTSSDSTRMRGLYTCGGGAGGRGGRAGDGGWGGGGARRRWRTAAGGSARRRGVGGGRTHGAGLHPLLAFCLENPGSMTYTMPSIVSDVSATLVDTTTLRPGLPPGTRGGGAAPKMRCCIAGDSVEYSGMAMRSPRSGDSPAPSFRILAHASSISCSPVRNTSTSPGSSHCSGRGRGEAGWEGVGV